MTIEIVSLLNEKAITASDDAVTVNKDPEEMTVE